MTVQCNAVRAENISARADCANDCETRRTAGLALR
jgi:hypothetical protein